MRRNIPISMLAAALYWTSAAVAAEPAAVELAQPGVECRRDAGTLTRYLLCLELGARRPAETHSLYYDELEELETGLLEDLPRGRGKQRPDILPSLYHAGRGGTIYLAQLTLVDALDWRRRDPERRLAADCDILSLLNAGVAARYYGDDRPQYQVLVARTSHDHVANLLIRATRPVSLLETVDGTILRGYLPARHDGRPIRPMTEREVVALYVAHVGLALAREGRDEAALDNLDEALRLNPGEFVAWAGRALALLLEVAAEPGDPALGSGPWCAGPAALPLLERADEAAARARARAPGEDSPYSLLGKIKLHQCEPEQARPYLERAVELSPDPLDLYYLGLILHEQESFREAIHQVRRGLQLVLAGGDPRYAALRHEMEFLLAHAYTQRANLLGSAGQLRKAMRYLEAVEREFPEDGTVLGLRRVIERLDHRIGPVRRDLGLPRLLGRSLYNASLDE